MKMKIAEAAVAARTLRLDLKDIEESLAEKVVDVFSELLPYAIQYDTAYAEFQKDAQGKKQEEWESLVSAKAFEKVANTEVEVESTLDGSELKALAKKKVISLADMAALWNWFVK